MPILTTAIVPGRAADGQVVRPCASVTTQDEVWPELELPLIGEHQAANAAVAVACISAAATSTSTM